MFVETSTRVLEGRAGLVVDVLAVVADHEQASGAALELEPREVRVDARLLAVRVRRRWFGDQRLWPRIVHVDDVVGARFPHGLAVGERDRPLDLRVGRSELDDSKRLSRILEAVVPDIGKNSKARRLRHNPVGRVAILVRGWCRRRAGGRRVSQRRRLMPDLRELLL